MRRAGYFACLMDTAEHLADADWALQETKASGLAGAGHGGDLLMSSNNWRGSQSEATRDN
jgi:hypothetical protein